MQRWKGAPIPLEILLPVKFILKNKCYVYLHPLVVFLVSLLYLVSKKIIRYAKQVHSSKGKMRYKSFGHPEVIHAEIVQENGSIVRNYDEILHRNPFESPSQNGLIWLGDVCEKFYYASKTKCNCGKKSILTNIHLSDANFSLFRWSSNLWIKCHIFLRVSTICLSRNIYNFVCSFSSFSIVFFL